MRATTRQPRFGGPLGEALVAGPPRLVRGRESANIDRINDLGGSAACTGYVDCEYAWYLRESARIIVFHHGPAPRAQSRAFGAASPVVEQCALFRRCRGRTGIKLPPGRSCGLESTADRQFHIGKPTFTRGGFHPSACGFENTPQPFSLFFLVFYSGSLN